MLNASSHTRLPPGVRCPAVGILAGGRSQRMGFDKAAALLDGTAMMVHVAQTAARVAERLYGVGRAGMEGWPPDLPIEFIPDADAEPIGPVGGILALLNVCQSPALVLGCDIPLIRADSIRALWKFHCDAGDVVATLSVSRGAAGARAEPVFAVYTPECGPLLKSIAAARESLQSLIDNPRVASFPIDSLLPDELLNVNDPATLARAEAAIQMRTQK